jgi:nuclear transport factor 2 (NTF2) superfamily protein
LDVLGVANQVIYKPASCEIALAKIKAGRNVWNIGAPDNRLEKTLLCYTDKQVGVSYEYEWHDDSGQWYRSSGNEFWEFNASGLIEQRIAGIYDVPIDETERKFR